MDRLVESLKTFTRFPAAKLLMACLASCWLAPLAAANTFPYVAYVKSEDAFVRSGPGQRYYPTSQLPQGFAVEVYRHESDGWCAIRPPEGSYSYVASHQVRQLDPKIVEVVDDNVVTRVGSLLSPSRTAVQVLLPKGERVELIPAGEDDDPRWVKVAPPAGEFRWIALESLSREAPVEKKPQADSAVTPVSNPSGSGWMRRSEQTTGGELPNDQQEVVTIPVSEHSSSAQVDQHFQTPLPRPVEPVPAKPVTSEVVASPNDMDVIAGSPAAMQMAQFQAQPAPPTLPQGAPLPGGTPFPTATNSLAQPPVAVAEATRPRVRFRGLSAASSATVGSIEELELRLSQTVVKQPNEWELQPLEAAAKRLLEGTNNPPLKAQLRDVLTRIDRFQEIKEGYINPGPTIVPVREVVASSAPVADPFEADAVAKPAAERDLTGLSANVRERVQEDLEGKERRVASRTEPVTPVNRPLYDATGLLKPVVSQRHKAPQYALVDEQGKVVSFITPTPELDLKPYLGKRIGVHGDRGYMPEYRRAHVTAGRVTPIEAGGTIRR